MSYFVRFVTIEFFKRLNMKDLVKSTRGTVRHYKDDSMEFIPQGKGEPVFEISYKVGDASIGLTKGVNQNYVGKLKCKADEPDPVEAMHEQLDKLAAKMFPDKKKDTKPRGRVLMDEKGLRATVNAKTGILAVRLDVDLAEGCDYPRTIISLITDLNQCLFINQDLLTRVARATAKPSRQ